MTSLTTLARLALELGGSLADEDGVPFAVGL